MDLGDDGHAGPGLGGGERSALTGQASADDQYILRGHSQQYK
jgi:hypothetical protein